MILRYDLGMRIWGIGVLLVALGCTGGKDPKVGEAGAECYGNGTCNAGLTCSNGVICEELIGEEGSPCYGNGTCNGGLSCIDDLCENLAGPDASPVPLVDARPASETMMLTFTTQPVGIDSTYAPTNIVATWVENNAGTFIETIDRQAAVRTNSLIAWRTQSGANDTDAVTGATRLNHATPISVFWTLPSNLPDGTYTIRIETCDTNASLARENAQGTFTFVKNGVASSQSGLTATGYSAVSIVYSGR